MFGSDGIADGDSGCIGACMPGSCGGEPGVSGDWASAGAAPMNMTRAVVARKRFMMLSFKSFETKRTRIDTTLAPLFEQRAPGAIVPRKHAKCHSSVY